MTKGRLSRVADDAARGVEVGEHLVEPSLQLLARQPRRLGQPDRGDLAEIGRQIFEQLIRRAVHLRVEKPHEERLAGQHRRLAGAQEQEVAALDLHSKSQSAIRYPRSTTSLSVRATSARVSGTL